MQKLGIAVALPQELQPLTRKSVQAGTCFWLNDHIVVCLNGIGPKRADVGGKKLIAEGIDILVSWGSAGALDESIPLGALLLPQKVMDASQNTFPAAENFYKKIKENLPSHIQVVHDPLAETPTPLADISQKKSFRETSGAVAVDMESGTLARLAHQHHIPFVVIRSVADTSTMSIPLSILKTMDAEGKINFAHLCQELLLHPADIRTLLHLGIGFGKAKNTLMQVANILKNWH